VTARSNIPLGCTRALIKERIKLQRSKEELDSPYLVCGEEGSGKSTVILNIIDIYEQETGEIIPIEQDATDLRGIIKSLSIKEKSIHALDEGEELNNLNQDRIVKLAKQIFVVSRARAQITLISYPNPFKINAYFKEDRAKGIFFCYKRKYVYFFYRDTFRKIREIASKNYMVKSINDFVEVYGYLADAIDTVPKYKGHLLEPYLKRKGENIDRVFNEVLSEINIDGKTYSLEKTCKALGVAKQTIYGAVERGAIVPKWNATHTKMRLSEQDLDRLREYLNPENTVNTETTDTLI
jgi:energy-coupling factor transporter ATP-binding protein EcfA2